VKILVSWLREYVDIPVPVRELARDLNLLGFEVASIEQRSTDPDAAVIDLEITANRPDALSVFGIAREVAVRYGRPLRTAVREAAEPGDGTLPLSVTIEAPDLCPRYAAAMADVRIGPSPDWMVERLAAAGVRAINNVVDVTNYVLLELGHPLHAFDYDKLHGHAIVVRRARDGERLTTLDGVDRALDPDMLVIADADRATAVAGVMGGGDSEVSSATTTIALESAWFLPRSVRRTSKRLGLQTEASYRFERGADPELPVAALARACQLLDETGAGRVRAGLVDAHPSPRTRSRVVLTGARLAQLAGVEVPPADVERILSGLGFEVTASADRSDARWLTVVPPWRGDVTGAADLVEEVLRHYGYDRLPTTFPSLDAAPSPPDARLRREQSARRLALACGFSESVTFTFIDRAAAAAFAEADHLVAIANPLSEKFAVLRPSLLPGLVDSVSHNRRREQRDVRLFETGTRFTTDAGEVRALGLAWTGAAAHPHWSGSGRTVDFFDMKGAVERVLAGFGLAPRFEVATRPFLVPGRTALVTVDHGDTRVVAGLVGELDARLAASRGLPPQDAVLVAEIDLDAIAPLASFGEHLQVEPLPRHPSVVRDLSIVVGEHLPAESLRATILESAPAFLAEVVEFARYQGKGVPEGAVSLSFRLTFRAPERTLTDEEVQSATDRIVAALAATHGARLR
jgi:phenylalanyl-tRNA synthetase beta chain